MIGCLDLIWPCVARAVSVRACGGLACFCLACLWARSLRCGRTRTHAHTGVLPTTYPPTRRPAGRPRLRARPLRRRPRPRGPDAGDRRRGGSPAAGAPGRDAAGAGRGVRRRDVRVRKKEAVRGGAAGARWGPARHGVVAARGVTCGALLVAFQLFFSLANHPQSTDCPYLFDSRTRSEVRAHACPCRSQSRRGADAIYRKILFGPAGKLPPTNVSRSGDPTKKQKKKGVPRRVAASPLEFQRPECSPSRPSAAQAPQASRAAPPVREAAG